MTRTNPVYYSVHVSTFLSKHPWCHCSILVIWGPGYIFIGRILTVNVKFTSMICVFSSSCSLRSCSVVLKTCSLSANSAAITFSFSCTWCCNFWTLSLCCSSISWMCCNKDAFSCSSYKYWKRIHVLLYIVM